MSALGVPCTGPARPVEAKKYAETPPGLASWAERHPYRLVFTTIGVTCAIVALVLASIATTT
ncbi:hypothetical protein [Actinomadura latina]|uniref:Uncharacterized protein n=1 Tax=Actinomadura latina TaxID=163603 RepID=A0A846Z1I0_9ACTN|nr:hypothetical protein [Actinomadura latina]NKZ06131.1 hypothetical protein [Actinomadura latina]